jgi:hypothetical protein
LFDFWHNLRHLATHAGITLLAVAIAFSLPQAASYILFTWWPRMLEDTRSLLYTEIAFAAVLIVFLNLLKLSWDYRQRARMSHIAALVYAAENDDWLSRWVKDKQLRAQPWKRDLTIMAVTGYGTFAAADSALREVLPDCYEIRVLLIDPYGPGATRYAAGHDDAEATLAEMRREWQASVASLKRLRGPGKNITLKLYEHPPFWKLVFAGEQVWVRCCHASRDAGKFPEYVFALQGSKPNRGFFPAFYTYFLNQWQDPRLPEYDFEHDELLFHDGKGGKPRRTPFPGAVDSASGSAQPALAPA